MQIGQEGPSLLLFDLTPAKGLENKAKTEILKLILDYPCSQKQKLIKNSLFQTKLFVAMSIDNTWSRVIQKPLIEED